MESTFKLKNIKLKVLHRNDFQNAPTLVFLHDSLGCIQLWREFPSLLAQQAKCNLLIYDRQGYGKSSDFTEKARENDYMEKEAEVLIQLLREFKIDKPILFGHSDGGTIALLAAAKYPNIIKGIITEGAHVFVEEITIRGIQGAVKSYQNTNLKEKLSKYHAEKTEGVFNAWTQTWLRESYRDWNIEHFLSKITCPSLIIQGENDEFGTLKQVHSIVNTVSGSTEMFILKGVGHSPHKENQEATLNKSLKFLDTLL